MNFAELVGSDAFQTAVSAGLPSGAAAWLGFRFAVRELFRRLAVIEATQVTHGGKIDELGLQVARLDERSRDRRRGPRS